MTVGSMNGREFERKILGRNGGYIVIRNKKNTTFSIAIRKALEGWDKETFYPNTDEADTLYYRVKKYLSGLGVKFNLLILLPAVETAADILYQTDAVLYMVAESGEEYAVTIDLSFSLNPEVEDEFLQVSNHNYLDLQCRLYLRKRGNKVYWPENRPTNHFLLTQFDVFRPRGLKTLSREIALSLFHQMKEREGIALEYKP